MDLIELEKEATAQYRTIEVLQKENLALRAEMQHLKELLTSTAPLMTGAVRIEVPKEQAACEVQLKMLHDKALQRELSLEETKRLEILIKSLYLVKDKNSETTIPIDPMSIEDLTALASNDPT
jgi:hypothetical protein